MKDAFGVERSDVVSKALPGAKLVTRLREARPQDLLSTKKVFNEGRNIQSYAHHYGQEQGLLTNEPTSRVRHLANMDANEAGIARHRGALKLEAKKLRRNSLAAGYGAGGAVGIAGGTVATNARAKRKKGKS